MESVATVMGQLVFVHGGRGGLVTIWGQSSVDTTRGELGTAHGR